MLNTTMLEKVRALLKEHDAPVWLTNTMDDHASEYPGARWRGIEALTGFTGSTAWCAVTQHNVYLLVDSRYWFQAESEAADCTIVRLGKSETPSLVEWLHKQAFNQLAINGPTTMMEHVERWKSKLKKTTFTVVSDWWNDVWPDRPNPVHSKLHRLNVGLSIRDKLSVVRQRMHMQGVDQFLITDLTDLAWLTNTRAQDAHHTPVYEAFGWLTRHDLFVYIDKNRLDETVTECWQKFGITVLDPSEMPTHFEEPIGFDPSSTNVGFTFDSPSPMLSPITQLKAIKHPLELAAWKEAFVRDGVALTEFYAELDEKLKAGIPLTELDVQALLAAWRQKDPSYREDSFGAIVAFGKHAACAHYQASPETNATLTRGLLLIDSGAHYDCGTTDVTRMTVVDYLTPLEREHATLVLKAHIALAKQIFPTGTSGAQMDALARAPLWQAGLDYGHGTGHGVGFVLSVHEGPFSVSPRAVKTGEDGLQVGRLFSNEPGFYLEGSHGIRWENLMLATHHSVVDDTPYIALTPMTLAAFDLRTIDPSLLTDEEDAWLRSYHALVHQQLSPYLSDRALAWFERATELPERHPMGVWSPN